MLENATEALDLILISSVSDIVTRDFEEAVVLEIELNLWHRGLASKDYVLKQRDTIRALMAT
jgi:hypothetical protein